MVVVVSKEWVDLAGVRSIIRQDGSKPQGPDDSHIIIAPLLDASHPRGLVVKIENSGLRTDGSQISIRFLIPWDRVYAWGEILEEDGERGDQKYGFAASAADGSVTVASQHG